MVSYFHGKVSTLLNSIKCLRLVADITGRKQETVLSGLTLNSWPQISYGSLVPPANPAALPSFLSSDFHHSLLPVPSHSYLISWSHSSPRNQTRMLSSSYPSSNQPIQIGIHSLILSLVAVEKCSYISVHLSTVPWAPPLLSPQGHRCCNYLLPPSSVNSPLSTLLPLSAYTLLHSYL